MGVDNSELLNFLCEIVNSKTSKIIPDFERQRL